MVWITIDWKHFFNRYIAHNHDLQDIESQVIVGHGKPVDSPDFVAGFLSWVAEETQAFPSVDELAQLREKLDFVSVPQSMAQSDPYQYAYHQGQKTFARYYSTPKGYIEGVDMFMGETLSPFLSTPQPFYLDHRSTEKHLSVFGSSGSGKSEFCKVLLWETITKRPDDCVIIIDPHDSISKQVAQWPVIDPDRLVYINPDLFDGEYTPTFNPLLETVDEKEADSRINSVLVALTAILGEESEFSKSMDALLRPVLKYLMTSDEPSSLDEVVAFLLQNERGRILRDKALLPGVLKNPNDRAYIETAFGKAGEQQNLGASKVSIQTRLQTILGQDVLQRFLCNDTSFDLAELISQKKIIIFGLVEESGSNRYSPMNDIGKLIFAQLLSIVLKDQGKTLPRINCYIDEAHNYTLPTVESILKEARKYGLHLTLLSQSINNFKDPHIKGAIKANTFIKCAGFQDSSYSEDNARLVGVSPNEITKLKPGQFIVSPGNLENFTVRSRADLIEPNSQKDPEGHRNFPHRVSEEKWTRILDDQKKRYYRPVETENEPVSDPDPQAEVQPQPQNPFEASPSPINMENPTLDDLKNKNPKKS